MQLTPRLVLMLATPPAMWASNAVVGRLAINSIDPLWLNAIRWMVAFVLLLPLGWAALSTPAARAQIAARWQYLAILGLIGVGAYNALQYMALRTSTPLNVTLIASSSPVWAMVVGALGYKVMPTRLQLIGAVLSLAGVALVMSRGNPAALADIQFVQGDLLMLLAIIGWSIYSWMLARGGLGRGGRWRWRPGRPVGPHPVVVAAGRRHRVHRDWPVHHRLSPVGPGGGRGRPGNGVDLLQPHPAFRRRAVCRGDRRVAPALPRRGFRADRGRHHGVLALHG